MSKIKPDHTSCKDCCFAIYKDITQSGCEMGILENAKDIVEVYDEEKEFYVLNNHKCHYKRPTAWQKELSIKEKIEKTREETILRYNAIIFAGDDMDDLLNTLYSLKDQDVPPVYITVVRHHNNKIPPSEIAKECISAGIPWRVQNLQYEMSDEDALVKVLAITKKPFFTIFYAGHSVSQSYFSELSEKVINHNWKFAAILPDETNNGFMMASTAYDYCRSHRSPDKSILEQLKDEKCPKYPKI